MMDLVCSWCRRGRHDRCSGGDCACEDCTETPEISRPPATQPA